MTALDFRPSPAARAMRSGRSGLVGVVTGAISGGASGPVSTGLPELHIVRGLQERLEEVGLTPLIVDAGRRAERTSALMGTLRRHRVEGVIHVSDHHRRVAIDADCAGAPLVLVNGYGPRDVSAVLPDDRAGQHDLTAMLIARGFRRLAYLGLGPELDATRLRLAGRAEALATAGIMDASGLVRTVPLASAEALWEALDAVLAEGPDVICFGNDAMAMRGYGMLRSRGLDLPCDLSVAGYDDQRSITEMLYPTLTSVELPYRRMGHAAAELLLARMREPDVPAPPPVLVRGEVVHRDSVARPAARAVTRTTSKGGTR